SNSSAVCRPCTKPSRFPQGAPAARRCRMDRFKNPLIQETSQFSLLIRHIAEMPQALLKINCTSVSNSMSDFSAAASCMVKKNVGADPKIRTVHLRASPVPNDHYDAMRPGGVF